MGTRSRAPILLTSAGEVVKKMKEKKDLSGLEYFFYYATVIGTLGGAWLYKIIMKKAISEMK